MVWAALAQFARLILEWAERRQVAWHERIVVEEVEQRWL